MKLARKIPVTFIFVINALAQQSASPDSTDKATIQALLVEVRQLRMALENSTSIVPRIQLAGQRLQAQQERVDRFSRELRDHRSQIAQHSAERDREAANMKQLETEMAQNSDPARHKDLERVLKLLPGEIERMSTREQQERAQEAELATQLQTEQAKLAAMAEQLEALDRKLQEPPACPAANQR